MLKKFLAVVAVCAFLFASPIVSQTSAAGGGKGGAGGGGTKVVTMRIAGYVTAKTPVTGGVAVTLGTSYYATGTALVTPNTKIRINGVSVDYSAADLRIGDFAEIDMTVVGRVAQKLEAIGPR